jgi:hypothetical protein
LNPKRRGNENVNFPCLNFLEVARGDFSPFRQVILRQFLEHPLAAHVRAEDFDSLPFFFGNGHDILHRFYTLNMNDTYIVKNRFPLAERHGFLRQLRLGNFLGGHFEPYQLKSEGC